MPRLHPTLAICLGLAAAGCLALAWQLHERLAESESALATANADKARLAARVAALEKNSRESRDRAALATRAAPADGSDADLPAVTGGPGPRDSRFAALRDSPEMQRLMAVQRRAALDTRYAALFKKLNLNPADLERFKTLLVQKQSAAGEVFAAARAEGLTMRDNRDQLQQMISNFESESDANIQSTLGEGAYEQYKQYEQTLPQRNVVGQLEQRLSYSSAPLSNAQTEQLVAALAAGKPSGGTAGAPGAAGAGTGAGPFAGGGPFGGGGRGSAITDAVVAESQGFLSAPQVDALRQLQSEQAAQAQLRQQMQAARRANNAAAGPTPPSGP